MRFAAAIFLMLFLGFSVAAQVETQVKTGGEPSQVNVVVAKPSDRRTVSKTYALKHADPYELRAALEMAVKSGSPMGRVECVKYADGKGALVISAEAYRFEKQASGQSIDELVEALDKPGASSAPDASEFKLITPQYIDADTAARMLRRSGLQRGRDPFELDAGGGTVRVDRGLNAIIVKTSPSNMKSVEAAMKAYDNPALELFLRVRVYELGEMDGQVLKAGFEAWSRTLKSPPQPLPCVGLPPMAAAYLEFLETQGKAALAYELGAPFIAGKPWLLKLDSTDSKVDDTGVWRTDLDPGLKVEASPSQSGVAVSVRCGWLAGFDKERKPVSGSASTSAVVPWGSSCIAGVESATRTRSFNGEHEFWTKLSGSVEGGLRRTRLAVLIEASTPPAAPSDKALGN